MRILPLLECNQLSELEIFECEHSDRLILDRRTFEKWMSENDPGIAVVLKITNFSGISVLGCIYGVYNKHSPTDESIIYAPTWMYDMFIGDTDSIEICQYFAEICRSITILPHTSDHIYTDDPQEYLRHGFERYTCIMKGMEYRLLCGEESNEFTVTIFDYEPAEQQFVYIRNCEMELQLMKPLDAPDTPDIPDITDKSSPPFLLPDMMSSVIADLSDTTPSISPISTAISETPMSDVRTPTADEARRNAAQAALKRIKGSS